MSNNNSRQIQALENLNISEGKFLTYFQKKVLLKSLQENLQPEYHHRIEIMLLADEGQSQSEICQILGCSQHIARYWIAIAQAGLAHKWQERPIGRPKTINEQYLQRLKELVTHSPHEYGYGFHSWTAQWLSKHLASELGIEISSRHINRLLKQMGLSTKQIYKNLKQETENCKDGGITITDLQLPCEPSFQWSLNKIKSDR
ncbi:helix-turn-helix domain-containing protein [Mastigocladus laminosus UU774]|nr:helix-turn-helix domain-containing protein [Mastigocladus laminosus UU774]